MFFVVARLVKIFFVLSALSIAFIANASSHDGMVFGDWIVSCQNAVDDTIIIENIHKEKTNTKRNKKKIENVSQQKYFLTQRLYINNNKNNVDKIVFLYIGYVGEEQPLRMVQFLPLPLNVEVGTAIISSNNFLSTGRYSVCNNDICQAVNDLTKKELDAILSSNDNNLTFMDDNEEQISISISTNGLKEGIEFLKSINNK